MITPTGYRELRKMRESRDVGPRGVLLHFRDALKSGDIKPQDVRLRPLFEALVPNGGEAVQYYNPANVGSYNLMEDAGAVDSSLFSNTSGLLVTTAALQGYDQPELLSSRLAPARPTQKKFERIAGVSQIGDEASIVGEGQPFPQAGVSETYVDTPITTKRGMIVSLTKEAIFHDETGELLTRAAEVGEMAAINKEKRVLDVVTGQTNPYKRNGTATDTYLSSGAYTNIASSNALQTWEDIQAAELLFEDMTDPETGEPIVITPNVMLVPGALRHAAMRLTGAINISQDLGAVSNTNFMVRTVSPNPIAGPYEVLTNAWVKARTSSASTWFIGQPNKAFAYNENWPITVVQAMSNSEVEFTHDIQNRWKVSEKGVAIVLDPRYMVESTA